MRIDAQALIYNWGGGGGGQYIHKNILNTNSLALEQKIKTKRMTTKQITRRSGVCYMVIYGHIQRIHDQITRRSGVCYMVIYGYIQRIHDQITRRSGVCYMVIYGHIQRIHDQITRRWVGWVGGWGVTWLVAENL